MSDTHDSMGTEPSGRGGGWDGVERRSGRDPRLDPQVGGDGRPPSGMERRRGPGRRLSDFARAAEDGRLTKEQFLFLMAIEQFKRSNQVSFPAWTDVLEVVRLLGYRKTMASEVRVSAAEDWREAPDAPSNVRTDRQWARQRAAERVPATGEAADRRAA
ncbi:MAG: hypothetical protein SFY69_07355 [Planctomycetota bacterium]|nr:hypothetical protein [Planctomycetota bacterium]